MFDQNKTIEKFPMVLDGLELNRLRDQIPRLPNLYLHTGFGGRGYVLAPYTAQLLVSHMIDGTQLSEGEPTL